MYICVYMCIYSFLYKYAYVFLQEARATFVGMVRQYSQQQLPPDEFAAQIQSVVDHYNIVVPLRYTPHRSHSTQHVSHVCVRRACECVHVCACARASRCCIVWGHLRRDLIICDRYLFGSIPRYM